MHVLSPRTRNNMTDILMDAKNIIELSATLEDLQEFIQNTPFPPSAISLHQRERCNRGNVKAAKTRHGLYLRNEAK